MSNALRLSVEQFNAIRERHLSAHARSPAPAKSPGARAVPNMSGGVESRARAQETRGTMPVNARNNSLGAYCEPLAGVAPGPLTLSRPSKFGSVKTNGYASKREAKRAAELRLLEKAGQIRNLREQVEYELIPKQDGERACKYRADFVYEELFAGVWCRVVEDCKGYRTPEYRIKRKLMLAVHCVKVRET